MQDYFWLFGPHPPSLRGRSKRPRARSLAVIAFLVLGAALPLTSLADSPVTGDAYTDELVVDGFRATTGLDWLPDGRALVAGRSGAIYLVDPVAATKELYLMLPFVDTDGERGLFDIAVAPDFDETGEVYLYYAESPSGALRLDVLRFTGDAALDAGTRSSVWTNPGPPSDQFGDTHVGGSVAIGPDNVVYLSAGDAAFGTNASLLTNVHGKILRIHRDGTVPSDNPFHDGSGPNLDEIWAIGVRNPVDGNFDPATGRYYFGDAGGNIVGRSYNEINVAQPGADFGWPTCEGPLEAPKAGPSCPATSTAPLHAYVHSPDVECCVGASVIGGEIVRSVELPSSLLGAYLFADAAHRELRYLRFAEDDSVVEAGRLTGLENRAPVWVGLGPDGHVYYLHTSAGSEASELRRLRYVGTADRPPSITQAGASVTRGAEPLIVQFRADAVDPDPDNVQYLWDFGDGTQAAVADPQHTYRGVGHYEAQLTVQSSGQTVRSERILIAVGQAPEVRISSPTADLRFHAGQSLRFTGETTDNEPLGEAGHRWDIGLSDGDHVHPLLSGATGRELLFEVPMTGHTFTRDTSLVVTLTVTDQEELQSSETIELRPASVELDLETSGLSFSALAVDGEMLATPASLETVTGFHHRLTARAQGCNGDAAAQFVRWSNGAPIDQSLIVAADAQTSLTAIYRDAEQACTGRPIGSFTAPPDAETYGNDGPFRFGGIATDDSAIVRIEWRIRDNDLGTFLDPESGRFTSAGRYTSIAIGPDTDYQPFAIDFTPAATGGDYRLQVRIIDDEGRLSRPLTRDVSILRDASTIPLCNGLEPTVVLGRGGYGAPTPTADVILGTRHADHIDGLGGDDVICGLNGADTIIGGAGNDVIFGGGGPDVLRGGDGADQMHGGNGDDVLRGGDGADTLRGDGGRDDIAGNGGDDSLFGGDDRDTLRGGLGDDIVRGGAGRDLVYGGNGDDFLGGAADVDICYSGPGDDEAQRCEFLTR